MAITTRQSDWAVLAALLVIVRVLSLLLRARGGSDEDGMPPPAF
jgi:hypothetical protein